MFEVGLGGRLDATNLVTPVLSVITRIDFDHENFLGHSIQEIAGEKAGILKPYVPVIVGEQRPEAREVILAHAKQTHSPVIDTSQMFRLSGVERKAGRARALVSEVESGWSMEIAPSLHGEFQLQNALNSVAAARWLQKRGYRDFRWRHLQMETGYQPGKLFGSRGRLEKLQSDPDVYLDGAHNPSAARELATFLEQNYAGRNIYLLYAAMRDKAVDEVAGQIFSYCDRSNLYGAA